MALSLDLATNGGTVGSGTSQTVSHTCSGSNRLLVVGVSASTSGSVDNISGVTYAGVAMIKIGSKANAGGNKIVGLFYLIAPATGANNVVTSISGGAVTIQTDAASFNGAAGSGQAVVTANSNPVGTTCPNTLTTTVDNSIHLVTYTVDAFGITSITNGTLIGNTLSYSNPLLITPAASHSMTANAGGSNNWGSLGAAFVPGSQGQNNDLFFAGL